MQWTAELVTFRDAPKGLREVATPEDARNGIVTLCYYLLPRTCT